MEPQVYSRAFFILVLEYLVLAIYHRDICRLTRNKRSGGPELKDTSDITVRFGFKHWVTRAKTVTTDRIVISYHDADDSHEELLLYRVI